MKYVIYLVLFSLVVPAQTAHTLVLSEKLQIQQLTPQVYLHVSNDEVEGFGLVASNGIIYVKDSSAWLFDTPISEENTIALVKWIKDSLKLNIEGFTPNHWHADCIGGLDYLHRIGVRSVANILTREMAEKNHLPLPRETFSDSLIIDFHGSPIILRYPGQAHATDNIVAWLPDENVLFAGCMAKDANAGSIGNLSAANTLAWPETIKKVMSWTPVNALIVPGHGKAGGWEIFTHTLELLEKLPGKK